MNKENFITEIDILEESKDCFLTYAEEVLTDRAIPAVEDGLLSAQRKILWKRPSCKPARFGISLVVWAKYLSRESGVIRTTRTTM